MTARPLSPGDIANAKSSTIPDEVIEAANELLAKRWDGYKSIFTLKELVALARSKRASVEHDSFLFDSGAYDIEIPFRESGWAVEFDRPGYNETYEAKFIFHKSTKPRGG